MLWTVPWSSHGPCTSVYSEALSSVVECRDKLGAARISLPDTPEDSLKTSIFRFAAALDFLYMNSVSPGLPFRGFTRM